MREVFWTWFFVEMECEDSGSTASKISLSFHLNKHDFSLHFRDSETPKAFLDTFPNGLPVVGELHIDDGLPGFYGDAGVGYFHGFYVAHERSFFCFVQGIAHCVPGERRYDGYVRGMGFEIEHEDFDER